LFYIWTLAVLQLCLGSCGCHAECYLFNNVNAVQSQRLFGRCNESFTDGGVCGSFYEFYARQIVSRMRVVRPFAATVNLLLPTTRIQAKALPLTRIRTE
jgi:hypothetical protein